VITSAAPESRKVAAGTMWTNVYPLFFASKIATSPGATASNTQKPGEPSQPGPLKIDPTNCSNRANSTLALDKPANG